MTVTSDWRSRARSLADELARIGDLRDQAWRAAFESVPRHAFLPGRPADVAYANDAIVTQTRRAVALGGDGVDLPTSSASAPGAVAVMLDRLDVRDDHRILEIGTGTGYNTALLCHRLGSAGVASIELDPELVESARVALAGLGYGPVLIAGDGYEGIPRYAPYDAILATCAVTHVPPAWVRQLKPGGRIVAPLLGGQDAALMVFVKTADDEVTGRFDGQRTSFMPLRAELTSPLEAPRILSPAALAMPHCGTTDLDPEAVADASGDLVLFLHLHIAGLSIGATVDTVSGRTVAVSDATSQAVVTLTPTRDGVWTVEQRGPRRLWDTVEHAVRLWRALGEPDRSRYGLTALDDPDRQYVWLDDPEGAYSWSMPL